MNARSKGAHRRPTRAKQFLALTVTALAVAGLVSFGAVDLTASAGPVAATAPVAAYEAPRLVETTLSTPSPVTTPIVVHAPHTVAPARVVSPPASPAPTKPVVPSGTLSCTGLEHLWEDAGGNPAYAFLAAEVAKAESGGRQYAHSPTDDIGYWQINVSAHPTLATYNPLGNARAAIIISGDGRNWNPWTTYRTGAYRGRC